MTANPDTDNSLVDADVIAFGGNDQGFLEYPQPRYAKMRARRPLLRVGDAVQTTTRAALDTALRNAAVYSSGKEAAPLGNERPLIPLQIDPPEHRKYRKLLDPLFSPRQMARLEPQIAAQVNELIDTFIERGSCDFTNEFAIPLPSTIFLRLFGLPLSELPQLLEFNERTQRPDGPPAQHLAIRQANARDVYRYFETVIAERRTQPLGDDLLSKLLVAEVEGVPLTDEELVDISFLMILAGLDTITDTLTCSFKFLAEHPAHRQQIVDHPSLIPSAVEELLRWETPVMSIIRVARDDSEIEGCPVHRGDILLACLGSANTDDAEFERAGEVVFDRNPNRHVAFGGGVHRCLGSHLARQELRVALREWHRRIPRYDLPPDFAPRYSDGLRSVRNLTLLFPPLSAGRPPAPGQRPGAVTRGASGA
ncbi:MAG TPA: cytochrome P450 [Acidimicrobiales bacterium]|nr:cytochrome P450 [Acidimicrobiales bacterium]